MTAPTHPDRREDEAVETCWLCDGLGQIRMLCPECVAKPAAGEPLDALWDEATNAVCQALQEANMCRCESGKCIAATVKPEAPTRKYWDVRRRPSPSPDMERVREAFVHHFLRWKLPESVCADLCATDKNYAYPRSGTNLLSATEAGLLFDEVVAPSLASLSQERAEGPLTSALRQVFPHFQDDKPVTPKAIRAIGREWQEMVMGWEPAKEEIEYTDAEGKQHRLIWESGDEDDGGWVEAAVEARKADTENPPLKAWRPDDGDHSSGLGKKVEAEPAPQVAIKPLEWRFNSCDGACIADTPIGRYIIEDRGLNWAADRYWFTLNYVELSRHKLPEYAKAAAQAHYETRVSSCLTSPPSSGLDREALSVALLHLETQWSDPAIDGSIRGAVLGVLADLRALTEAEGR